MKIADFNLLKKFMAMTESGSDQEVLTAMKKVNEILKRSDTNWQRVLDRVVTIDHQVEAAPEERRRDPSESGRRRYLGDLLDDVEANATGTFADFVADLRAQFERSGLLSTNQVSALESARTRHRSSRRA